ncbi:transposase [Chitinophaga silvisoli]|uniref:transposase n=1 Tax=Chitinophaga silvisoli TaxID=2291814 RepID=UPI0018F16366|nr:transposase [Chitinophaga silvisoli]
MFARCTIIHNGYQISLRLGEVFRHSTSKEHAYNDVEEAGLPSFKTLTRTIQHHYLGILNFLNNRATNAAAESV